MREMHALPWSLVAVMGILAVLILAGHDSVITMSLAGLNAAYIGIDQWSRKRRPPRG